MTIQVQNTIRRLVAHHGYSASFIRHMGEGICLYSIGGIMYRIRGDGTILQGIEMKNWICYNLLGEHPDDMDTFGMVSGLGIQAFLVFWAFYLFVYIPFFYFG